MGKNNRRYYAPSSYSEKSFDRWEKEEDEQILKRDFSDRELSVIMARSIAAIQKRRWLLKKQGRLT